MIAAVVTMILLTGAGQGTSAADTPAAEAAAAVETEKTEPLSPMAIECLRQGSYPGGDFVVEVQLADGLGFKQYVVSYLSEGLKR